MRLIPHPDSSAGPVSAIQVEVSRRPGGYLSASYRLVAPRTEIVWPGNTDSGFQWERADDLWRHTCFEVFVGTPGEAGYFELNFATGGRWAAYAFYEYRNGMRTADDVELTQGNWAVRSLRGELSVLLRAPVAYEQADWRVNISAVVETTSGTKSYWALAHPDGPPDFHDPACFVLELPAAG